MQLRRLKNHTRRVLGEKFGNKYVKILKFGRTELSYGQNKNRGEKMGLLGMDRCPSLNDTPLTFHWHNVKTNMTP
jgi:hypothetical protein